MITTIKITKYIKLQQCSNHGLKVFLKYKGKWIMIKLTNYQVELLQYILNIINGKHEK